MTWHGQRVVKSCVGRIQERIFEFTMLYAYQQNGTVKQSMCTVLNGVRSTIAESGIFLKY